MKTKNKIGPNTEPCGTLDVTVTICDLFDRKALIQT